MDSAIEMLLRADRQSLRDLLVVSAKLPALENQPAGAKITYFTFPQFLCGRDEEQSPTADTLVLEYVDRAQLEKCLPRAYTVLKPGGQIVISAPGWRTADLRTLLFREGFEALTWKKEKKVLYLSAARSVAPPPYRRRMSLTVVMPVFNEIRTFRTVMELVLAKTILGMDIDFILIESNSTDGTRAEVMSFANHSRVRVLLEERPQGKGHAVRAGLEAAKGDFILIQDADLEYSIDDYDRLVEPLCHFECGFVLGNRHAADDTAYNLRHFTDQKFVGRVMNFGHFVFLNLFNLIYGQRLKDPFTMYKVFRRDCLRGLEFECNRFDFDWEIVAKLIRSGFSPREIPVSYVSRSFAEGKKVTFIGDPISWIIACFKYRFTKIGP
jgi:hypothetical protein